MICYLDSDGKHVGICNICRKDMPEGESAFAIAPGQVNAGFFSRDYARQEKVICTDCIVALAGMIDILANPRLRTPSFLKLLEAA